jgi:hypothetical protein
MHWNPKGCALCATLSLAVLAGCAHKSEPPAPAPAPAPAAAPAPAPAKAPAKSSGKTKAAPAPAAAAAAAPKGGAIAQIKEDMSDADVVKILGEPTGRREFPSPKAFAPYYYGPDTWRAEWSYKGKGRVLLYKNRFTGAWSVLEATADPSTP